MKGNHTFMNLAPTENLYMIRRMSSNEVKRALNITLGKNLKRLRLVHGLTQEQLAEMADTDKRYISAMEGGRGIGPRMFNRLCAALGVDSQEFIRPPYDLDDALSTHPEPKSFGNQRDRSNEIRRVSHHPQTTKVVLIDEPEISIHHKFLLEMFDVLDSEGQDEVIKYIVKKLPRGKKN